MQKVEDFILRAGVSRIGVAANSPEEAIYMSLHSDIDGNLLDGHYNLMDSPW